MMMPISWTLRTMLNPAGQQKIHRFRYDVLAVLRDVHQTTVWAEGITKNHARICKFICVSLDCLRMIKMMMCYCIQMSRKMMRIASNDYRAKQKCDDVYRFFRFDTLKFHHIYIYNKIITLLYTFQSSQSILLYILSKSISLSLFLSFSHHPIRQMMIDDNFHVKRGLLLTQW